MDKNVMNDESLWVVHYGHNQYPSSKPVGGLWGCWLVGGKNAWQEWCVENEFRLDKYGHDNCVL